MPILLEEDSHANERLVMNGRKGWFTRLINCIRIYNIPLLNFVIIGILGFFLIKLTTKYTGLYMKSSLVTLIVTNLVLYGISETLAQSILSYKANQPALSFRLNELTQPISLNPQDILHPRLSLSHDTEQEATSESNNAFSGQNNVDEEDIERFIDYLQENSSEDDEFDNFGQLPPPIIELTYFQFNRLAGFMCWGCILAFFQCWWYKFLQIYSKDPKFIEVLRKVLTDQLCYSPISLFCFFTYGTIILESGTWEDAKKKLRKIYLKTLVINYCVWFPVQFFNFLMVSRDFQVPFSSSVSVLWNCFLSMRNSKN